MDLPLSIFQKKNSNKWSSKIISWIIYDCCNSLFHTGIVGLFLPLWITITNGGTDAHYGFAVALAMSVVILGSPLVGYLHDTKFNRYTGLAWLTALSSISIFILGIGNVSLLFGLSLFIIAFICLAFAELLYNTTLADIASPKDIGSIGGLGVGLGYFGSMIAVFIGLIGMDMLGHSYEFAFWLIGVLMALLASPLIIVGLKGRTKNTSSSRNRLDVPVTKIPKNISSQNGYLQLRQRFFRAIGMSEILPILKIKYIGVFLIARFWYIWMVSVGSSFGVLYATQSVGMTPEEVQRVLFAGLVVAIPSGFLWGKAVDRVGPIKCLLLCLSGWVVLISVAVAIPLFELPSATWWGVGMSAGAFFGAIWVADRPIIIALSPPQLLGSVFGLYMTVGRLGYAVGAACWSLVAVTFGFGQPAAMAILVLCTIFAIGFLSRVKIPKQKFPPRLPNTQ